MHWLVADASQVCGAVREMRWTPDGTALAMCWEHGGFSIWSVFGSLLHHSMAVEAGCVVAVICSRATFTNCPVLSQVVVDLVVSAS